MTITTINLTSEDKDLIKELNLSPTELIREKLAEFRIAVSKSKADLKNLEKECNYYETRCELFTNFLKSKDLFQEFINWSTGNV